MAPPLAKNREHIQDIFLGIWPTTVSLLTTATAYQSSLKYLLKSMHPISLYSHGNHVSWMEYTAILITIHVHITRKNFV